MLLTPQEHFQESNSHVTITYNYNIRGAINTEQIKESISILHDIVYEAEFIKFTINITYYVMQFLLEGKCSSQIATKYFLYLMLW